MNNSISRLSGYLYPDRTFSIGRIPFPKKKKDEREYDLEHERQMDSYAYTYQQYGRTCYATQRFFSKTVTPRKFIRSPESSQNNQKSSRYGLKGITDKGKKWVKNSAILIEEEYGKNRIGFVTCTVPSFSKEAMEHIASDWNEIVRRFYQRIRRVQKKRGAPLDLVSVTEIQGKRWKKYKQCVPHLHFAYVALPRNRKGFYISAKEFRAFWEKEITASMQRGDVLHGCNESVFGASVNCTIVKKSVAGYLGKYLSKGCEVVEKIIEEGFQESLPRQWWSLSSVSRSKLKKRIIKFKDEHIVTLFYDIHEFVKNGEVLKYSYIDALIEGRSVIVGMCGVVSQSLYSFLDMYDDT